VTGGANRLARRLMPSITYSMFAMKHYSPSDRTPDHAMRQARIALLTVVAIALLALTPGCAGEEADTELETETGETVRDPVQVPDAERIDVTLDDFVIEMPDTLEPGTIAFVATNRGTVEHSFEVENGDVHQRIPDELRSGETQELLAELEPGVYRAYCPVEDHAERGMEKQIVVR